MATFTGLTLNNVIGSTTFTASGGGVTSTVTTPLSVTAAPATQLVVTQQPPANVPIGAVIPVTVVAEDPSGNIDLTYNGNVTISLANNAEAASLGGTLTVQAHNGVAQFPNVTLNHAGDGYTLQLSSGVLINATTSAFNVAATQLVVTGQPNPTFVAGSGSFTITVKAEDGFGSTPASPLNTGGVVTLSLAGNPTGVSFPQQTATFDSNGVATFSVSTLNTVGSGYTFLLSYPGLTSTTTSAVNVIPGTPTQFVVTTPPPGSVAAGNPFIVSVTAEDANSNPVPTFSGSVNLSITMIGSVNTGPSGQTLGGTVTATFVGGVATFPMATLSQAGPGTQLTATAATGTTALTPATTGAITVTGATVGATHLTLVQTPPSVLSAGGLFGLTVNALNSSNNPDQLYNGQVTVTITQGPAGATIVGQTSTAVIAPTGLATFTNLALDVAGSYTIQVASNGLAPVSFTTVVNNLPATQLVVTTQPAASVTAGASFGLVVSAEDQFGNVDPNYAGGNIVLALGNNQNGGVLTGTTTETPVAGVALFPGLSLTTAGSNYFLQATSGILTSIQSSAFTVTPAAATQLVVTVEPPATVNTQIPNATTSQSIGGVKGVQVSAEDQFGNLVTTFSGAVAIALGSNPVGPTLGGVVTQTAVGGVATFTGLTLNKDASDYTLVASTANNSLTPVTTTPFAVLPTLTISAPPNVVAGTPTAVTVTAKDGFGDVDSTFNGNVTLAMGTNAAGSTLSGQLTVTANNGVATFTGLSLNKASTATVTMTVASTGLTSITSASFTVTPNNPSLLIVATQPTTSVNQGSALGTTPKFQVEDVFSNVLTSAGASLILTEGFAADPFASTLGYVGSFTVNSQGAGYTAAPTIAVSGGGGSSTPVPTVALSGTQPSPISSSLTTVSTFTSSGYTLSGPTVSFTVSGATTIATATANLVTTAAFSGGTAALTPQFNRTGAGIQVEAYGAVGTRRLAGPGARPGRSRSPSLRSRPTRSRSSRPPPRGWRSRSSPPRRSTPAPGSRLRSPSRMLPATS